MATNFKYALISDLTKHFTRINDYDDKRQIFPSSTSTNLHTFQNCGDVDTFFVNGEEQGAENTDTPNSNGEWKYDSNTNKLQYYNDGYTSTTINEQVFEAGDDFVTALGLSLEDASSELHNYLDQRYSTPIQKTKLIDIDTNPVSISEEYDPIIIKATCYIAIANLIRAKEGASEEADYFMNLVTNAERTGIVDKLNDGIYKLANEVDANDKKGSILGRTTSGTMDLVELSGAYEGENYDLLRIEVSTTGAYGVGKFVVKHFGNDKLEGQTSEEEVITGGLQHIHNGISGRFQGASATDGDYWYIEVYGSHIKQTNKSNSTIEMVR